MKTAALSLLLILSASACSKLQSEPTSTQGTSATPLPPMGTMTAPAPETANAVNTGSGSGAPKEVAWNAPVSFKEAPNPSTMRKATYKVGDAELSITEAGGEVDANIKRWADQFGGAAPKVEKKKINGIPVTVVEMKGTFNGGMMGGTPTQKSESMLLGAVFETSPVLTFFKFTGSEKTVSAAHADFDKLVASVHAK